MRILCLAIILSCASALCGGERKYIPVDSIVDYYGFKVNVPSDELAIEARAAFDFGRNRQGRSSAYWGIAWNCNGDYSEFDYVALRLKNTDFGTITDTRAADVEYGHHCNGIDSVIACATVEASHNLNGGENTLAVEWIDGVMKVFSGEKILAPSLDVAATPPAVSECRVFSTGNLKLKSVVIEREEDLFTRLQLPYTLDQLSSLPRRMEGIEGLWTYLDRVTDDNRARLGGMYNLWIVKDGDRYLVLYHSGAKVNSEKWNRMMIKGELQPTPFVGHFDLKWYDAMMHEVDDECSATLDGEGILSLSFPIHKSSIRFYRNTKSILPE
ncbi:MAG: hypothetical protein HDS41_01830 [Bacteroides sp.]|nr:hypothetical protein [Bacteroides sp.]